MPVTVSYPGVYIEEIPSGVRTITGVATSIAAFVGRAKRGPVNDAVVINGFGDFERIFGGLWLESSLGYAVRDFYLNGGSQAIIVRLYNAADAPALSHATLEANGLKLKAVSPGKWADQLRARIDHDVKGTDAANLFNLFVQDGSTGQVEVFRNVSHVAGHPRQVDKVLETESALTRLDGALPGAKPGKHADPTAGQDIWKEDTLSAKVADDKKASDGDALVVDDFIGAGKEDAKEGLFALRKADLFNILCIPPYLATGDVDANLITAAAAYCEKRRAMLLVDPPSAWKTKEAAKNGVGTVGTNSKNSALFFPRIYEFDPLRDNRLEEVVPCGAVAGIFARTDTQRGVWKAPAGLEATLAGVPKLTVSLTDAENGELNPLGINCLRNMPAAGRVVWGSRTLQGDDRLASEWKYIPVRRTALFIEESLYRGTQWVVFEPNDEPLWAQIRTSVGAFMNNLFKQGAFQGSSPREAYLVKCDKETTTQNDINLGIVNIVVGFAPLKPAEFVIIKIQQLAGQIET
ncbi:MAG TPA: phage tail sheath subtilisin-like domain-containing protein [Thermoanaerobaculia bacterium]